MHKNQDRPFAVRAGARQKVEARTGFLFQILLKAYWWVGHLMQSLERFHLGEVRPLYALISYIVLFRLIPSLMALHIEIEKLSIIVAVAMMVFRAMMMLYGARCVYLSFKKHPVKRVLRWVVVAFISLDVLIAFWIPVYILSIIIEYSGLSLLNLS